MKVADAWREPTPVTSRTGANPEEPEQSLAEREELRELRLSHAFTLALRGAMSKGPDRKYWQTNRLNARHLRVIQMRAAGYKNHEIATLLGYTQARVSVIINQPESQRLLAQLVSVAADDVLDVQTRIKAHAGEMLDIVVSTARNAEDEALRAKAAFRLLDMAGYGKIERKEVAFVAKIDEREAQNLKSALLDAMALDAEEVEARFEVLGSEVEGAKSEAESPVDDVTEADGPRPSAALTRV